MLISYRSLLVEVMIMDKIKELEQLNKQYLDLKHGLMNKEKQNKQGKALLETSLNQSFSMQAIILNRLL